MAFFYFIFFSYSKIIIATTLRQRSRVAGTGPVVKPGITSRLQREGFGFKSRPVHFESAAIADIIYHIHPSNDENLDSLRRAKSCS